MVSIALVSTRHLYLAQNVKLEAIFNISFSYNIYIQSMFVADAATFLSISS